MHKRIRAGAGAAIRRMPAADIDPDAHCGVGIDIGDTALRLVSLSRVRRQRKWGGRGEPDIGPAMPRWRLERQAGSALPSGMVVGGRIAQPEQLAVHIGDLLRRSGIRADKVAVALPAHAVIGLPLQLPAGPFWKARYARATAEAARYFSIAEADVCVDYRILTEKSETSQPPDALTWWLAAARREQVEERLAATAAAGLTATVLDIDLYAAYAACTAAAENRTREPAPARMTGDDAADRSDGRPGAIGGAVLIVGAAGSHLALFDRERMLFQRPLPGCYRATGRDAGARHAVRAEAIAAEGFTTSVGIDAGSDPDTGPGLAAGIDHGNNAITALADAAARALLPADVSPQRVYIGGDAAIADLCALAQALQYRTGIRCDVVDPFASMQDAGADAGIDGASSMLVACGLAMRMVPW